MSGAAVPSMEHDFDLQAEIVRHYVRNPSDRRAANRLLKYAQSRTVDGPIWIPPERTFKLEFGQECADGINYGPWAVRRGEVTFDQAAQACAHLWAATRIMGCGFEDMKRPAPD